MHQRIHHNLQPIHQSGQKKVPIPARALQNLVTETQKQNSSIYKHGPEQDTYALTHEKTKLFLFEVLKFTSTPIYTPKGMAQKLVKSKVLSRRSMQC